MAKWHYKVGDKVRVVSSPKYPKVCSTNGVGDIVCLLGNTPGVVGVQFSRDVAGGHDCDRGTGAHDCLWLAEAVLEESR